jgi:hypothetical protein
MEITEFTRSNLPKLSRAQKDFLSHLEKAQLEGYTHDLYDGKVLNVNDMLISYHPPDDFPAGIWTVWTDSCDGRVQTRINRTIIALLKKGVLADTGKTWDREYGWAWKDNGTPVSHHRKWVLSFMEDVEDLHRVGEDGSWWWERRC